MGDRLNAGFFYALVALSVFALSEVNAVVDNEVQGIIDCAQQNSSRLPEGFSSIFGDNTGDIVESFLNSQPGLNVFNAYRQIAEQVAHLGGVGPLRVSLTEDEDGNQHFSMGYPENYSQVDNMDRIIEAYCHQYAEKTGLSLAQRCMESRRERRERLGVLWDNNSELTKEVVKEMDGVESPEDILRLFEGESIEVSPETTTHFRFSDIIVSHASIAPHLSGYGVNSNGQRIGPVLRVHAEGKGVEEYVLPHLGQGQYLNPMYLYVFGGDAEEWNRALGVAELVTPGT